MHVQNPLLLQGEVVLHCKVIAIVRYPNFDILLLAQHQLKATRQQQGVEYRTFQANRQQCMPFAGAACSSFCKSCLQQLPQKLPAKAE